MKTPNTIQQIHAKGRLISELRKNGHIDEAVAIGALAKLGSDVCDMLSGDLSKHLEQRFESSKRSATTPKEVEEFEALIYACHEARDEV
jgi:hypothetical protein